MRKKWLCFLAVCLLVCGWYSVSFAAEPASLHLENVQFSDGKLTVLCNSNVEQSLSPDLFSVTLEGRSLPVEAVQSYKETALGSTWIFLVDVSGSIQPAYLTEIQTILGLIKDALPQEDNAAVFTVGNEIRQNPFSSDKLELQAQIEAIQGVGEDTNLYRGILESLERLNSFPESRRKKNLVILSDGEDYYTTGVTREEVDKKIAETRIPVFTIAMLADAGNPALVESAKILGSFARGSAGGLDITYGSGTSEESAQAAATQIVSAVEQSYLLTCDAAALPSLTESQEYLRVDVKSEQGNAQDGVPFFTAPIKTWQEQQAAASSEPPISEPPSSEAPVPDASSPVLWIALAAAVLLIAGLLVVFLLVRRRRKKKAAALLKQQEEENAPRTEPVIPVQDEEPEPQPRTEAPPSAPKPGVHLKLTRVGMPEEECYELEMPDSLVLGSDPAKSQLAFPQDPLLSGAHCRLDLKEHRLTISALEGETSVNGAFVKLGLPLRQDDIISLGSMELRVQWEEPTG